MLELSAFASLAQFGAGLGLALSFFMEPVTARARRLRLELDSEFSLIPQASNPTNNARRSAVCLNIINLDSTYKHALTKSKYPILAIKIGCAINFLLLISCTVAPESELTPFWIRTLFVISVGPILLASASLIKIGIKYIPKPS